MRLPVRISPPLTKRTDDRLGAAAGEDLAAADEAQRRLAEAATTAIAVGATLSAIADAERTGELRARGAIGTVRAILSRATLSTNSSELPAAVEGAEDVERSPS